MVKPSDIESGMVDGQFIMRNHEVLTMDEASIICEADMVGRRIWNQVLQAGPLTLPGPIAPVMTTGLTGNLIQAKLVEPSYQAVGRVH